MDLKCHHFFMKTYSNHMANQVMSSYNNNNNNYIAAKNVGF